MTRLAEEGDVDACLTLGYMYLYGENGVARDPERAFKYYSMAAAQEDKIAVNNLGSLYYSGIGTEKALPRRCRCLTRQQSSAMAKRQSILLLFI